MVNARADHVGSLLRPPELLRARAAHAAGQLDHASFKRIEDRAIREVIELQEGAGCEVVTDGEFRRESFQSELTASVDGVEGVNIDAWLWGDWHSDGVGDKRIARPEALAVTAAAPATVSGQRGVRVSARPHRSRSEGHVASRPASGDPWLADAGPRGVRTASTRSSTMSIPWRRGTPGWTSGCDRLSDVAGAARPTSRLVARAMGGRAFRASVGSCRRGAKCLAGLM